MKISEKRCWITGIVPAVYTPMLAGGSINFDLIPELVEHLISEAADALYVCGSTGEGPSLSTKERMEVAESYVRAAKSRIPVIVQVGHNSLKQARRLAQHAQEIGADAISAIPPTYFKIESIELLMDCLVEIVSGAPKLPFYYYHIPRLTAVQMDMVQFLKLGMHRLSTLNGIKYSHSSVWELQACLQVEEGRFNMLFGLDEMLLSGLIGGAHGAVGSTYNFALPLFKKIFNAYERGDIQEAQNFQDLAVRMVHLTNLFSTGSSNAPAQKAMMKIIDLDCGPMRLPQKGLSNEKIEDLKNELTLIGFFDWGRN